MDEQMEIMEITEIIKQIDRRIVLKHKKLRKIKKLKQALMQDLLTGKVRVQVN